MDQLVYSHFVPYYYINFKLQCKANQPKQVMRVKWEDTAPDRPEK
jgi:hypothetical protein